MSKLRQHISAPGLLQTIRQRFSNIPDSRMGTPRISLPDGLMAGLAVFGLKCSSLLQFDQQRCDPVVEHNLRQLYGIAQVPCDTQLRKILDPVDPRWLRPAFKAVFAQAQRSKVLEDYVFFDGHYLLALDGTGFFASSSVSCPHCCVKKAGTDKERYYHQLLGGVLVHPDHKEVIPLAPEPILRADGQKKNDCERHAAKRFLADTRREHPHLPLIVVEDTLAANGPHIETLQSKDMRFILGVKPGSHYALFEDAQTAFNSGQGQYLELTDADNDRIMHRFRWVNDLALNDSHPDLRVHFLDYEQIGPKKKPQHFTWITDLPLTPETVYTIMRGGRARWKIENETFNTLKNQGYHLEHNYGHGDQYLASVFAYLTMLAFLVDQLQKHACPLFRQALEKNHSMRGLWDKMRVFFLGFLIEDWTTFFHALIYGQGRTLLTPNTS